MMNKRTAERTVTALFTCLIEDMRMTKGRTAGVRPVVEDRGSTTGGGGGPREYDRWWRRTAGVRPVVEEDVGVRQKLRAGNKV